MKFRAWDKIKKEMVYRFFAIDNTNGRCYNVEEPMKDLSYFLMQYTGLKDKNGKEIYEGDILCLVQDVIVENIEGYNRSEPEGLIHQVTYNNGAFWFYDELLCEVLTDVEIIGNIYEHSELLKLN